MSTMVINRIKWKCSYGIRVMNVYNMCLYSLLSIITPFSLVSNEQTLHALERLISHVNCMRRIERLCVWFQVYVFTAAFVKGCVFSQKNHRWGQVWYQNNSKRSLFPTMLNMVLRKICNWRYEDAKRVRDFWDTMYVFCCRWTFFTKSKTWITYNPWKK